MPMPDPHNPWLDHSPDYEQRKRNYSRPSSTGEGSYRLLAIMVGVVGLLIVVTSL
jgi:hypothetical protein